MKIRFPESVREEFPDTFPIAWQACADVAVATRNADLTSLSRRSPALAGFDWSVYLRLSCIRMVRAYSALRSAGAQQGRLLDLGAYFGNFSLMFARLGFEVDALDSYATYAPAFDSIASMLRIEGIRVLDSESIGLDMAGVSAETYDVVACMGVIEHVPHTPRPLLEAVNRVLKPGGVLVLDTPNLTYSYKRQRLNRGESIFCPIELQYETEIPFEGHHREFTRQEVRWLLNRIGHDLLVVDMYNFSVYALSELTGIDLENYRASQVDADLREIILTASRKRLDSRSTGTQVNSQYHGRDR